MPTYEYRCDGCSHEFEQEQRISEDALVDCSECGEPKLKRLISATAFHLKGSGWYKTDYASSGSKSSDSSNSDESKTKSDKSATSSEGTKGSTDSGKSVKTDKSKKPSTSAS